METSASVRKPLRARKTMTPSSRKQVAMLNRLKGLGGPGGASSGSFTSAGPNLWSPKEQDALLPPPPPLVWTPATDLAAGSETGVRGGPPEAAPELPKSPPKTNADVEQFLSAGALQDLLYQLYENEPSVWPPKPVEVRLDLAPANCGSECSEGPRLPPAPAANCSEEQGGEEPLLDGLPPSVSERGNGGSLRHREAPDPSVQLGEPADEAQQKRRKLDGNEGAPPERPTASGGAGKDGRQQNNLERVMAFVQGHLDAAVGALDRGLQDTNRRLERTRCQHKQDGITVKERTAMLEKRLNAVFALQAELSKKMKLLGSAAPNQILNGCRSLPGHAHPQLGSLGKTTSAGSKASPQGAQSLASSRAPPQAAESLDEVVCLETCPPALPTARPSGVPQDGTPGTAAVLAPTPASRKDELVIDLTEEGSGPGAALGEEAAAAAAKAVPAPESPEADTPQPPLPAPMEVPWECVRLPPLPKVLLLPPDVRDFQGTAPPQKLQLTVVKLLQPKGLALQWDIRQAGDRCAPLDSFHLFFFVDGASTPFAWTRMKVIKALPLPMFITLGALPAAGVYYFTMQAKDVYGRYGPFSAVQSASVP